MSTFATGDYVTNGSSAMCLTARVEKDPRWKVAGWRGTNIALGRFGGNAGMSSFVPDYLLASWRKLPFDWAPVVGGSLVERYVFWAGSYSHLQREVRR